MNKISLFSRAALTVVLSFCLATHIGCGKGERGVGTSGGAPDHTPPAKKVDPFVGVWRFQKLGDGNIWVWIDVSNKVVFLTDPRIAPGKIGLSVYEALVDTGGSWQQAGGVYTLTLERHKETPTEITAENLPALRQPLPANNRVSWSDHYKWSGSELIRINQDGTPSDRDDKLLRVPKAELELVSQRFPDWIYKPLVLRILPLVPA